MLSWFCAGHTGRLTDVSAHSFIHGFSCAREGLRACSLESAPQPEKVKAALTVYIGAAGINTVANEHLIRYPAA